MSEVKASLSYLRVQLDDTLIPQNVNNKSNKKTTNADIMMWLKNKEHLHANLDLTERDGKEFLQLNYTENHFFNAIIHSYNQHLPPVVRPDDLAIMLVLTVAKAIDLNPNDLKSAFFTPPKTKSKDDDGSSPSPYLEVWQDGGALWDIFFSKMVQKIKNNVTERGQKILNSFDCSNYSTSSIISECVANIQIMSVMKNYFSYGMMLGCGIPEVVLLGSVEDWNKLEMNYKNLKEHLPELNWWYRWLDIVIDMLINMRRLKPEGDPQSNIVKSSQVPNEYKEIWKRVVCRVPQGSGGQSHLGGWIHILAPFCCSGRKIVDEKTGEYDPLMPMNKSIPNNRERKYDCYEFQDVQHDFFKARDWSDVMKSVGSSNVKTNWLGDISIESGFYGCVEYNIPDSDISGIRPICGYRVTSGFTNKNESENDNDEIDHVENENEVEYDPSI